MDSNDLTIKLKVVVVKSLVEIFIRICNIEEESLYFKDLINFSCCYNAEWEYKDNELTIKVFNYMYYNYLFEDIYTYLFGSDIFYNSNFNS